MVTSPLKTEWILEKIKPFKILSTPWPQLQAASVGGTFASLFAHLIVAPYYQDGEH